MRRKTKTQLSIRRVKQRKKKKQLICKVSTNEQKKKKKKPSSKLPILAENKNIREKKECLGYRARQPKTKKKKEQTIEKKKVLQISLLTIKKKKTATDSFSF